MTRPAMIGAVAIAILVALIAPGASAAEIQRRSGTVEAVDRDRGALVVGEVGPWQVKNGETVVIRRTFAVTGSTRFVRVERRPETQTGAWPGDFVEVPLAAWDVKPGQFVTVESEPGAARPTASRVLVVVP